jgi:hypothetical protein
MSYALATSCSQVRHNGETVLQCPIVPGTAILAQLFLYIHLFVFRQYNRQFILVHCSYIFIQYSLKISLPNPLEHVKLFFLQHQVAKSLSLIRIAHCAASLFFFLLFLNFPLLLFFHSFIAFIFICLAVCSQ